MSGVNSVLGGGKVASGKWQLVFRCEFPGLTCIAVGGNGCQAGVIADARALDMRLRVGGLHLAGVVRLRRLAVVALHRVLLRAAHGGVVHAGRTDRVGGGAAGLGLDGDREEDDAEEYLRMEVTMYMVPVCQRKLQA